MPLPPSRTSHQRTSHQRAPRLLVVKFGGTSVANASRVRRAARRVASLQGAGWTPVVVVSAAGHTTDRLLTNLAHLAPDHLENPLVRREADRLLATGETRSAALLAAALCATGVPATSVRADEAVLRAEGPYGAATLVALEPGAIASAVGNRVVPVVAGFQGIRADGELVTLGRGSSDTSAVFLASALGARECHIVTDVRGVYDADPRLVEGARFLPELGADELVALCEAGAQVVHPEAARRARDGD
ncbi:MAG TPA: hypothetical protein VHM67_03210, partial [Gemmatimonadaceae bacterium]|nr:hypothetical protein [Gemmatimonadaceae bacterium]